MAREQPPPSPDPSRPPERSRRPDATRPEPSAANEMVEAVRVDLLDHSTTYDFYYAVGMMERLHPHAVRIGGDGPYAGERIRFKHDPTLVFSPGDITSVEWNAKPQAVEDLLEGKEHRFEVMTSFLGLTGGVTPLPLYLAEEIAQAQDSAKTKRDFLDMFHHRLISFVYRIGVKYDLAREYARDQSDEWSRRMLSLVGFDAYAGRKLRHIPLWRLLRLGPLLASSVRSSRTLELALEDLCGEALEGAHVYLEQFAGGWSPLDSEQRCMLGIKNTTLGMNSVLGVNCFDKAGKAIIVIKPLRENFRRFLTDGDMYPLIIEALGLLSPEPIEFELDLVLTDEARPPFKLGVHDGGRVGVDSWLGSSYGPQSETHLRVPLPAELPRDPNAFKPKWQSQPQRASAE